MLVLTRKAGEKIYIGKDICITICDVDRNVVKVGIEAPRSVPIVRDNATKKHTDDFPEGNKN